MSRARDLSNFLVQDSRLLNVDSDYIQLRQATADLSNLNASNLTSGSIPNARVPSGAVTQHVSAVTNTTGTWTPSFSTGSITIVHGARYQRVGNMVKCFMYVKTTSTVSYSNTNVMYLNGLPITSRNTGNTYDVVGIGTFQGKSSYGSMVHGVVRSNSTSVYFIRSGGDIRALSDYQGLANSQDLGSISHYGTVRNFRNAFENNQNNHMLLELMYFV